MKKFIKNSKILSKDTLSSTPHCFLASLNHLLRYAIDSSKLQKELGWVPSLQFEEGLDRTVDWYFSNEEWLNNVTSGDYAKYYQQQYDKR